MSMSIIRQLTDLSIPFRLDEPMSRHTSWRIGGKADVYVSLTTPKELTAVIAACNQTSTPYFILGKGSNILISDKGIRGLVITLSGEFSTIEYNQDTIAVGAGVSFIRFCLLSAKKGYAGMEFGAGIPGSIGGAVRMNAGAHGSDVANVLINATVSNKHGELLTLSKEELDFSYRSSKIDKEDWVVHKATFKLPKRDPAQIASLTAKNKHYRMQTQPLKNPSCGSVFKNPLPQHAGNLIEKAGLKGFCIGGAEVSTLHGNFIINKGEATASDVKKVIQHCQEKVLANFGVTLYPEVKMIGF